MHSTKFKQRRTTQVPFLKHPVTKVTLFVGQKDFEKHQATEKQMAEEKKKAKSTVGKRAVTNTAHASSFTQGKKTK